MNVDVARALAAIAIGVLFVVRGIRVRAGASRDWVIRLQDPGYPAIARNAPFMAIPTGLLLVAGGLLYLLPDSGPLNAARLLIGFGMIPGLPLVLLGYSFPPRALIPDWYVARREAPNRGITDWIVVGVTVAAGIVATVVIVILAVVNSSLPR